MPVNWHKGRLRDGGLLVLLLLCGVGLLVWSRQTAAAVARAVELCLSVLLPSLFPFFVLSELLVGSGVTRRLSTLTAPAMGRLFGLPGSLAPAVLLGMVGGYPVGAKTVAGLYEKGLCSQEAALRALVFCNNAGPAFVISAVGGGLLKDVRLGALLYGLHIISALLMGLLNNDHSATVKLSDITAIPTKKQPLIAVFLRSVTGAFDTFLHVCAFVLLFAVVMSLLGQLPLLAALPPLWQGLLSGCLELTSGTAALAAAALSRKMLMAGLCFLCGWGGCSVQLQTVSLLQEAGLPCGRYLRAKLLHGGFSAALALLLC